ncbi:MAG: DinB family protein, partial [Gemmatimonadota bacterium]
MTDFDALRFPIGPFQPRSGLTMEEREGLIHELAGFPAEFRAAVKGLSDAQLDTPYREGGWTIRQVAHHVPDSHLQGYVRFKLAMTEDAPTIKTYRHPELGEISLDTTLQLYAWHGKHHLAHVKLV